MKAEKDGDLVDVSCDCGQEHKAVVRGDEGQRLEWTRPATGETMSDTNA